MSTIEELQRLRESEDHVEFKEAKRNYPFAGGKHTDPKDRRHCVLGYVVALANECGGRTPHRTGYGHGTGTAGRSACGL